MRLSNQLACPRKCRPATFVKGGRPAGFTLVETVLSLGMAGLMVGGLVVGYMQAVWVAEWSGYSLAANALALQGLEQARAAKWDPRAYPAVDQLMSANFPDRVEILDIPMCRSNIVYATNHTTIRTLCSSPPLKMIQVDCTWYFLNRGVFTSSVFTFRAPDQ